MISMYKCIVCMFETNRKDVFTRHQLGKKHLQKVIDNSNHDMQLTKNASENVVQNVNNVVQNKHNVVQNIDNVVKYEENVILDSEIHNYTCQKCNKIYKTKEYLKKHEKKCTGIDSLTCPKCMKRFADRHSKSKHCKKNNCKPSSIFEAENVKSIINNTTNTNQSYNTNSLNTITPTEKKNETNLFIFIHSKTMFQIIC